MQQDGVSLVQNGPDRGPNRQDMGLNGPDIDPNKVEKDKNPILTF